MTLEQLNYVIEVSKTNSINKAANHLFVSQSTLSMAIQNLEKELGADIFVRTRRGVELTPFGRSFISYLIPIQIQLKQISNMTACKTNHPAIVLTVANDGFHQPSIVCAELFNQYRVAGIRIEQFDSYGNEARKLVADRVAEIGIIRLWSCYKRMELKQFEAMGLSYHPVYEADLAVTVGPRNPLFSMEIDYVTTEMLADYPMIKYGYLDSGPFADIIDRIGLQSDISTMITSSRTVIDEMLERTDAYYLNSMWPDMRENNGPAKQRTIPLRGTDIRSELGWIAQRSANLSWIALEFTKRLEQKFV